MSTLSMSWHNAWPFTGQVSFFRPRTKQQNSPLRQARPASPLTELCKQEAVPAPGELLSRKAVSSGTQDQSGESLPAKPVHTDTVMTTEKPTPLATAVAGLHTHTSVADAPSI